MGTSQHKVFSTYIMQGNFTLPLPATVSTVETVKAAQLLHNSSALTADWPYTRRELSCRISPSRPEILSLFLCVFFQLQHAPDGKIKKSDVTVAKNYLSQDEMKQLNRMVTAYLDFAENMTLRHIPLTMQDWEKRLNSFISS